MGSVRLTLCTGLLAAVAFTPAAHAADGADVSVTPSSPAPGGTVALRVGGCDARTATAVSDAFAGDLTLSGSGGTLTGESRVRTSAAAGPHDVTITCGATRLTGTITVSTAGQSATSPDSPASPVAPVPAGGGGTAHFASADAQVPLPGTAHAVIGLVLAGLAAVTVGLRSARRSRGAD